MELVEKITEYAEDATRGSEYFVVQVSRAGNSRVISVLVDGDQGISIEKCSEISRYISRKIDEEIGDDVPAFTVEVSSPGADKPLRLERQYPKHTGRTLKFTDAGGVSHEGVIKSVANGEIVIEETKVEKGKKPVITENKYSLDSITDPKVVISFKR